MKDIRTPNTYYETPEEKDQSLEKLKSKLDDLLIAVQALKGKKGNSPATERIVDNEIDKLEKVKYRKNSKDRAQKFVEEMVHGDPDTAMDYLMDCLDYKAFVRAEPYLQQTGKMMEHQIFSSNK